MDLANITQTATGRLSQTCTVAIWRLLVERR
jgi:hypothetical protein